MAAETAKRRHGDLYAVGDYPFWSRVFEPASEALIEGARMSAGHGVLDVAAGDGNTALAAAKRGAIVAALDISPAQIERGRSRARREGRSVAWVKGDARRLPFGDGSFDRVFNSFGDEVAVEEMFRVVRAGGVIGITDWTGEGFDRELWELHASFTPGETGGQAGPWGREDSVLTGLAPYAGSIEMRRHVIPAWFESVRSFCTEFPKRTPETNLLQRELSSEQRERFSEELRRLAVAWNRADDGSLLVELNYLLTIATKPETGI